VSRTGGTRNTYCTGAYADAHDARDARRTYDDKQQTNGSRVELDGTRILWDRRTWPLKPCVADVLETIWLAGLASYRLVMCGLVATSMPRP
jgi:hypothetical protein